MTRASQPGVPADPLFEPSRPQVAPSRLVFRFEQSMSLAEGDALLLRQLCLHTAFPTEVRTQGL